VQDLVLGSHVIDFQCERWQAPDGKVTTAPLPPSIAGHFGPQLRRFVLAQYHQGQTTVSRLVTLLQALGIDISKREVVRLLTAGQDGFRDEARDVLRAGLASGAWITVDDTGARHKARNGFCTQIGNAHFTAFVTTAAKSRLNFLGLLRAGHGDYVVNLGRREPMKSDYRVPRQLAKPSFPPATRHKTRVDVWGVSAFESARSRPSIDEATKLASECLRGLPVAALIDRPGPVIAPRAPRTDSVDRPRKAARSAFARSTLQVPWAIWKRFQMHGLAAEPVQGLLARLMRPAGPSGGRCAGTLTPGGFSLLGQHCIIPKRGGQGGYDGNTDRHGSYGRYEASVRSGRRRRRG
jgi:hypothetical protein